MRRVELGTFQVTPEMMYLINQVLRSGRLSYGVMSKELEYRFARIHGYNYGVLSNSGTSSLLVALQTLKEIHHWHDGDEVIVPTLTFVATVNVVLQLNLKPVLVDIERDFYGIDVAKMEDAMTERTRCIIPVHTFGQPCDMRGVYDVCLNRLHVIEDSCETMFVKSNSPNYSDIACYSTYIGHLLVTGVGGISATGVREYAQYMRSLVNHGITLDGLPNGNSYDPSWLARKFIFDKIGYSFRITELEAALGLAQLDTFPEMIHKRQRNAVYLSQGLNDLAEFLQLPGIRADTEHAFMMYPLVCKQAGIRNDLIRYLNTKGIGTRLMLPLTNQLCYYGMWDTEDYPVAKWINENGYYIGCHQDLTRDDLDYVAQAHYDYFKKVS